MFFKYNSDSGVLSGILFYNAMPSDMECANWKIEGFDL